MTIQLYNLSPDVTISDLENTFSFYREKMEIKVYIAKEADSCSIRADVDVILAVEDPENRKALEDTISEGLKEKGFSLAMIDEGDSPLGDPYCEHPPCKKVDASSWVFTI